jgi:hypothetical protein
MRHNCWRVMGADYLSEGRVSQDAGTCVGIVIAERMVISW